LAPISRGYGGTTVSDHTSITLCFSALHTISSEGTCASSATPRGRSQKAERGVQKSVCSPHQVSAFVTSVAPCRYLVLIEREITAAAFMECPLGDTVEHTVELRCLWQLAQSLSDISPTCCKTAASIAFASLVCASILTWHKLCCGGEIPVSCKKGYADCIRFVGSLTASKDRPLPSALGTAV
jgi:hypothetical protein